MQQKQLSNVEISSTGKKLRSKSTKGTVLRAAGLVSKLKVVCVVFLVRYAVNAAFKRRNISNWKENTFIIDVRRRFTSRWACFEAKSCLRCIRRVNCNRSSVQTSKYLQLERNYGQNRRKEQFCGQLALFRS
jgi:hypothetical protein